MELTDIRIPESHKQPLLFLAEMETSHFSALEAALRAIRPMLSPHHIGDQLTGVPIDKPNLDGLVRVVLVLYSVREDVRTSGEILAKRIAELAVEQEIGDLRTQPTKVDQFSQRLAALLSLDETIGLIAKAAHVLVAHERPYLSATVYTDMRPIFPPGESTSEPAGAMIVHQLAVTFSSDHGDQSHYFALDVSDLRELQNAIVRALAKEAALKRFLEASSLKYLGDPSI